MIVNLPGSPKACEECLDFIWILCPMVWIYCEVKAENVQGSKQVPGLIIKNRSDSMKKILEMLAVGFVALAIAGCGGGEKPAAKSAEKNPQRKR